MSSEREKMLAGELYDPLDADLSAGRSHARNLLYELNHSRDGEEALRRRIMLDLLGKGGDTAWIEPPFYCDYGVNIELGERAFFNFNCVVLDVAKVRIGSHAFIGPAVQIYTALHPLDPELRRTREYARPVDIGDDVWIGGGAIVLPGVHIGSGSVIGAGSVVTRDIPEAVVAVGNPCRVVRGVEG